MNQRVPKKKTKTKTKGPKKRKLFPTARVGPRTTVLRSRLVIDFATTANIEEFVKLIIFTAFVHEILPVDAV